MSNIYSRTRNNRPARSAFNLSYEKKMDGDMGLLYPIMCEEVVPGDVVRLGHEVVTRFQPLVAPVMHEMNIYIHDFFVPYRLLSEDWEEFISGGTNGDSSATLPTWNPTNTAIGSLWDYLGFPTGIVPAGALPLDFPRRAYNMVYNDYYRDQTLQSEVALTNETILRRSWEKDYFTSALPFQQRGIAPALPISGITNAEWSYPLIIDGPVGTSLQFRNNALDSRASVPDSQAVINARAFFNANTVDFSDAATFDVSDLRLAFQIQRWMERNARAGVRYTEFLQAHYGVSPRDERLDRPEYIGGTKAPVIISEVLQTSSTDATTPQGNLAGHGISASGNMAGTYRVQEFGLIIGILSVMPRSAYQQGINRQWLRRSKYDFYFPEFAHLSEQPIEQAEIYATAVESENKTVFGYQGRYNEMRSKSNMVCGNMRDTLDYWHLGRQFSSPPLLNESFILCNPDKRIFAVPSEPGLIMNIGNIITALRPMPAMAEPGLIDHN
ncbi:MAG: hypothetical protein EOM59_16605 [Clostridia bacterium]|nr:hypothetical protein [Clostridia bacterium]